MGSEMCIRDRAVPTARDWPGTFAERDVHPAGANQRHLASRRRGWIRAETGGATGRAGGGHCVGVVGAGRCGGARISGGSCGFARGVVPGHQRLRGEFVVVADLSAVRKITGSGEVYRAGQKRLDAKASRAGSLPQGSSSCTDFVSSEDPLWERACSRKRSREQRLS